ncbi:nucleotidyltransferase family protein [Luminiphilus sp.]|nr:nucleotidyltransferase family protein [Luminiphilus sp.]
MKAMVLAAGEGRRMKPLTEAKPKPLLTVAGRPLIEHHIVGLRDAGVTEIVVNVSHLGQQLVEFLGDGSRWGVEIMISEEASPLETAGGIVQALPWLGNQPFLLVNGDIYTDFPFVTLKQVSLVAGGAYLVMVPNPSHHPKGDFCFNGNRLNFINEASLAGEPAAPAQSVTYSGIGLYDPQLFAAEAPGKKPLRPLLDRAVADVLLQGELFTGLWEDIGTPERLASINARFPSVPVSQ